jgi:preprotein translocase subunit SecD
LEVEEDKKNGYLLNTTKVITGNFKNLNKQTVERDQSKYQVKFSIDHHIQMVSKKNKTSQPHKIKIIPLIDHQD